MDTMQTKERRKRKRKSDYQQIQHEDEPAAKRQKVTFELPAELLLELFVYCDPTDLIIMGRVCKFWNECASSRFRWRLFSSVYVVPTGVSWELDKYDFNTSNGK